MKKGFTLIELLAVIVILAVIAIIAVPIVLNVIEKSKEGAAVDSAYGYIHAIEQSVAIKEIKDKVLVSNGTYEDLREFETTNNVTLKGKKPSSGYFKLEKRRVVEAEFIIDGYRILCDKNKCSTRGKVEKVIVSYNAMGGTLSKTEDEIYKGDTLTLPTPIKDANIFIGWYTEENGGELVTNSTSITGNMTLYAHYASATTEFDYAGEEQTYTAPLTGTYKLEVWGGGSTNRGYGGYSVGNVVLTKGDILYVNVGGTQVAAGGYNGGAKGGNYGPGGAGATHIALDSGLLSSLSDHATDGRILIVAGGGGGNAHYLSNIAGGNGGGITGGNGGVQFAYSWCSYGVPAGGSQTGGGNGAGSNVLVSGHACTRVVGGSGTFGQGGIGAAASGGGGYYGGGGGVANDSVVGSGAGGSGYVGSSNLISSGDVTKHMTCNSCTTSDDESTKTISNTCSNSNPTEDCSKTGNGYAKITYLGE